MVSLDLKLPIRIEESCLESIQSDTIQNTPWTRRIWIFLGVRDPTVPHVEETCGRLIGEDCFGEHFLYWPRLDWVGQFSSAKPLPLHYQGYFYLVHKRTGSEDGFGDFRMQVSKSIVQSCSLASIYLLDQCPIHDGYMKNLYFHCQIARCWSRAVGALLTLCISIVAVGRRSHVETADEKSEAQNPASNNQLLYSATIQSFMEWIRNIPTSKSKSGEPGTSGKIPTPLVR